MRKSILAILVCLPFFNVIKAQEKLNELDPVTVTSSLTPTNISSTGRNLLVIKGDEFLNLPVHSIDDLLRYLPGIEIQARGPMGAQSDIVMRGGTFQQVLVILDGLRLNDPNTGHFNSYIPIAVSEIERIEILKGASSAIYGSDAVGGVIRIITKSFSLNKGVYKTVQGSITGGNFGLINGNAGINYSNGKTSFGGGFLTNNATGEQLRGETGYFHLNTASVSVMHQINNYWSIGARAAYDDRRFAAQNFYTSSVADTGRESVRTLWTQIQANYKNAGNSISINAGYKLVKDHYSFNSVIPSNDNTSILLQSLITYDHKFSEATQMVLGTQFQNRSIKSNDRGNHTVAEAALFGILQQKIGSNFNMSPALRLDYDAGSGTEFIPQLNLSYHIHSIQFRASAGKTIRQGDFTERYNNYNKTFIPNLNRVGNPDLKAERSFSFEGGADLFLAQHLKISLSYFQRNYRDLIDYVSTPYSQMPRKDNLSPTGTYFLAGNLENLTTKGIETDIVYSRKINTNEQVFFSTGFLWLASSSENATPSLYISTHARYLLNFSANYTSKYFGISCNGIYKDRNPQSAANIHAILSKEYFVFNVKAEVYPIKKRLSLFAEADNIFNKGYTDLLGAQMPGRWLMAGLQVTLSK